MSGGLLQHRPPASSDGHAHPCAAVHRRPVGHGAAPGAVPEPVGGDQRAGSDWVSRRVTTNGVVCVSWQQVSLGRYYAGSRCDVHVDGNLLRFYVGDDLVKTAAHHSRWLWWAWRSGQPPVAVWTILTTIITAATIK
jgi:hypothetical protein